MLALGALVAAGPARADTASSPAESITGNFSYPPFSIQVSAQRAAGTAATAATGSFTGTLAVGGAKVGDFAGPVTCLDVEGNSVGLFYPVKSADPAVIADVPFGVLVTITRTSAGAPSGLTFVPLPETQVSSCAPTPLTFFPITSGTVSWTPGPAATAAVPATTLAITNNVPLGHSASEHANVLSTAGGRTVYTLSGETARHPKCTKANRCTRAWVPVTVGRGVTPSEPSNVSGKLGVWRHKGLRQLTFNGHPLYTFVGDSGSGTATGAGIHSFGGTWNVVRTPAALTPPTTTTTPGPAPPPPLY